MRAVLVAVAAAIAGCAAIVGVTDRSGSVCARETHDLCEDFDNPGAAHVWNGPDGSDDPRVRGGLVPSDQSPPNALELRFPALDVDAQATGLFGDVFHDKSPDGMKVSFDLRVDELGAPAGPVDIPDGSPLPVAGVAYFVLQWNRGGVAIAGISDGAYLFIGKRVESAPTPAFDRWVRLAARDEFIGKWTHVELAFALGASPPTVEVRFGGRPEINPTFDPSVTQLMQSIDCLFGGVAIGPTGPNRVTYDNFRVDVPKAAVTR